MSAASGEKPPSLSPTVREALEQCIAALHGEDLWKAIRGLMRKHPGDATALERWLELAARLPATPERIGRFTILDTLGSGGFGIVYLAEQTSPFFQYVAVKIIRTRPKKKQRHEAEQMFDKELELLNTLSHPNITRLLDAGRTEHDGPYIVTEYVNGETLQQYARKNRLELRARLDLFVQLCSGIGHAHEQNIIHLDLSDSNILVTEIDGRPCVKIIDFGISRYLASPALGGIMGHPECMPPEQALGAFNIDKRADIYALGVQLYALLTGTYPIDPEELRVTDTWPQVVEECVPEHPSARLLGEGITERDLSAEPIALAKRVRGDLDWITMKMLAKDKGDRYEAAADVVRDLERFFSHKPVQAAPASRTYRCSKFLKRNRAVIIAVAATLLGTVILGAVSSPLWGPLLRP